MKVYPILWNEEESREYGELLVVCSSKEKAIQWCNSNKYDYTLVKDGGVATVRIAEMELE